MPVYVVTGASRGIGQCICDILLTKTEPTSIKIIAVARSISPLQQLQTKYGSDRVSIIAGDLSEQSTVTEITQLINDKYDGELSGIIANAGVLDPVDRIADANITEWVKLFQINFFSIVLLISSTLPFLRKAHGQVVLVSSGASTKGYYGWGAYGASKAALNQFAAQLAAEEADIKVVAVAPGVVDTQMQIDIREKFGSNMTPESLQRFIDLKENNQLVKPEVPATIYANLAVKGIPSDLNGSYLRYNDEKLASFAI
ncbi:hypothetical protein WICPIJ_003212 [Wickerhamomyces pijperi]|uniref:Uncharacterized protein n=1 Tax=Wickerhamomyces pijperi TaxID=599730 RepID=A0A9P8Q825_WICPI|nr:hypothetical protein WICPIJ_003212 [Wickerhamomyces pijperi]